MLRIAKPHLVHDLFAKKANIPKHGGVSVQWRRVERPAASTTALTEGTAGAAVNLTISSVSVTVQQLGQFSRHSDLQQDQSIDVLLTEFTDVWAQAMAISIDQSTRNTITGGSTVSV